MQDFHNVNSGGTNSKQCALKD